MDTFDRGRRSGGRPAADEAAGPRRDAGRCHPGRGTGEPDYRTGVHLASDPGGGPSADRGLHRLSGDYGGPETSAPGHPALSGGDVHLSRPESGGGIFHLAGNRPGSAHFPVLCRSRRYDGHPAHRPGHGGGRLHGGGDAVRADGIRHGLSALHHCPGRPEDRGGPDGAGGGSGNALPGKKKGACQPAEVSSYFRCGAGSGHPGQAVRCAGGYPQ